MKAKVIYTERIQYDGKMYTAKLIRIPAPDVWTNNIYIRRFTIFDDIGALESSHIACAEHKTDAEAIREMIEEIDKTLSTIEEEAEDGTV